MSFLHPLLVTFLLALPTPQESPPVEASKGASQDRTTQGAPAVAKAVPATGADRLQEALAATDRRLKDGVEELKVLRDRIAEERVPLARRLGELEMQRNQTQKEYNETTKALNTIGFEFSRLTNSVDRKQKEAAYLQGLLEDFAREFQARLHVSEIDRYEEVSNRARDAAGDANLAPAEVFRRQVALLSTSLDRLEEGLRGSRFQGKAVDASRRVTEGTFLLLGPAGIFRSDDGRVVGMVDQRVNSGQAGVIPYSDPALAEAASALIQNGSGVFPLDPTLGNAQKVQEATEETFLEHVAKGGEVMWPIGIMAAAALLVAIYKWIGLARVKQPSRKQVARLMEAVEQRDFPAAQEQTRSLGGPVGVMLSAGVEHIEEPRELIEEVMFEQVMVAKMKLNSLLPFIAICAASAPLLGLLGTVTGIIDTFKMITIFGSGDVKMLSGGISAALITTKFGLIVAIPSLLIHAFLSRKARRVIGRMESTAVAFANQVDRLHLFGPAAAEDAGRLGSVPAAVSAAGVAGQVSEEAVRSQVQAILQDLLDPMVREGGEFERGPLDGGAGRGAMHTTRGGVES